MKYVNIKAGNSVTLTSNARNDGIIIFGAEANVSTLKGFGFITHRSVTMLVFNWIHENASRWSVEVNGLDLTITNNSEYNGSISIISTKEFT